MSCGLAQANLETVLGFELAQEDYEAITAIDFQLRLVDGIRFLRPEGPFRYGLCRQSCCKAAK